MTSKTDSDQSFRERVEEIREERQGGKKRSNASTDVDMGPAKAIGIFVGILFTLGLIIGALGAGEPGAALFILAIAGGIFVALTKEGRKAGREFMKELEQANQQQSNSSKSGSTRVCSNCGWQNPASNNFCHDCGSELEDGK